MWDELLTPRRSISARRACSRRRTGPSSICPTHRRRLAGHRGIRGSRFRTRWGWCPRRGMALERAAWTVHVEGRRVQCHWAGSESWGLSRVQVIGCDRPCSSYFHIIPLAALSGHSPPCNHTPSFAYHLTLNPATFYMYNPF